MEDFNFSLDVDLDDFNNLTVVDQEEGDNNKQVKKPAPNSLSTFMPKDFSDEDLKRIDAEMKKNGNVEDQNENEDDEFTEEESLSTDSKVVKKDILTEIFLELKNDSIVNFEDTDIEDLSYDKIAAIIEKTIRENEYADLTDEQKDYLKVIRSGANYDQYKSIKEDIDYLKTLTPEVIKSDISIQEDLLYFDFKNQGMTDERAKSLVDLAIGHPKAFELALEAKKSLEISRALQAEKIIVDKEKEKLSKIENAKKELETIKEKIIKTESIIEGVKINEQVKEKVFKSLATPTKIEGSQAINEVMDAYNKDADYKIRLHYLHTITKGFTDFSSLDKKFETKQIKKIDKKLEEIRKSGGVRSAGDNGISGSEIHTFIKNLKL